MLQSGTALNWMLWENFMSSCCSSHLRFSARLRSYLRWRSRAKSRYACAAVGYSASSIWSGAWPDVAGCGLPPLSRWIVGVRRVDAGGCCARTPAGRLEEGFADADGGEIFNGSASRASVGSIDDAMVDGFDTVDTSTRSCSSTDERVSGGNYTIGRPH